MNHVAIVPIVGEVMELSMSSAAPRRGNFQQLADLVHRHAAAKGWPEVTYQASFITVVRAGSDDARLEGNSLFWNVEWDANVVGVDHPVSVASGEDAWQAFLGAAFHPDLVRADAELQKR